MLRYFWDLIGLATLATEHLFDWSSSLILSQFIFFTYFALGITSNLFVAECNAQRTHIGIILRGFCMSATILVVIDCMSVAAWIAMPSLDLGLLPANLFMTLRIAFNLVRLAVVLAGGLWSKLADAPRGKGPRLSKKDRQQPDPADAAERQCSPMDEEKAKMLEKRLFPAEEQLNEPRQEKKMMKQKKKSASNKLFGPLSRNTMRWTAG